MGNAVYRPGFAGVGGCDKIPKEIRGPWFQSMVSIALRAYCPRGISEAEKTGRKG